MKNRLTRALACWLVLLSIGITGEVSPSTLDERIQLALKQNPELKYYEAELTAAKGERTQAGLWKNPEISAQYGTLRKKDAEGSLTGDGFSRGFSLSQTFEFPGKGSLRKAIANKNVEMATLALEQFRLALSIQVRALSGRYQLQAERMEIAREISGRHRAIRNLMRGKPSAGTAQWLEAKVIEGATTELQQQAEESFQQMEETRLDILRLMGAPSSLALSPKVQMGTKWKAIKSSDAAFAALSHHIPLKIHELEIGKASREVTAAALESAPDFSVGPFFSQDKSGDREETFGVTLSTTLPLWNWNQGNIKIAQARKEQAESLMLDARRKVEIEALRRCRQLESAGRILKETGPKEVDEFRAAADLADRQFRLGAISVNLYLEAQRGCWTSAQIYSESKEKEWMARCDLELMTAGKLEIFKP